MSARDDWVSAVSLLREYLSDDHALSRAIKARRWSELAAVTDLANGGLDDDLALTDPVLYKALRDSITKFHLRGYACLDADLLRQKEGEEIPGVLE